MTTALPNTSEDTPSALSRVLSAAGRVLGVVFIFCLILWVVLVLMSPSGMGPRHEERETPLAHPLSVTKIDGLTLTAGGQQFTIDQTRTHEHGMRPAPPLNTHIKSQKTARADS